MFWPGTAHDSGPSPRFKARFAGDSRRLLAAEALARHRAPLAAAARILGPGVPVVFLTAKVQPADVDRLRGLGAIGVLAKPFDPMRLPGELAKVLASR